MTTKQEYDDIEDQGWLIVDTGSSVIDANGEQIGTVGTKTPDYLTLRVKKNLLTDVEIYVPRTMIERIEGDSVRLRYAGADLMDMDLTQPPGDA